MLSSASADAVSQAAVSSVIQLLEIDAFAIQLIFSRPHQSIVPSPTPSETNNDIDLTIPTRFADAGCIAASAKLMAAPSRC